MNTNHVIKIMLPLAQAAEVAVPGAQIAAFGGEAEPPEKLHVTLAFLGKRIDYTQRGVIMRACEAAAQRCRSPQPAHLGALQRFHFPKRDVVWASVQADWLRPLREQLVDALRAGGVAVDDQHDQAGWTPHVTVAKVPPGVFVPQRYDVPMKVSLASVTYKMGSVGDCFFRFGEDLDR